MSTTRTVAALAALSVLAMSAGHGCADGGTSATSRPSPGSGGASESTGASGGDGGSAGACVDLLVEAEITRTPVDVIFVVDNSGSMVEEVDGIEANISVNFAEIFETTGVDYRVIMVTDHGLDRQFSKNVCIGPPLSNTDDCAGPPGFVPGQFYHYDIHIESLDSACWLLASMYGNAPDEWDLAPSGWNAWLRPEAIKVFVAVTDDKMLCSYGVLLEDDGDVAMGEQAALAFDQQLLQLNPAHFGGSAAQRNYIFYSIVGLISKNDPLEPYAPDAPVTTDTCSTATSAGTGYQWLSKMTGGLRFPVCNHQSYDAVFEHIATGVIDVTAIPCQLDLPAAPAGEVLDLDGIALLFTSGAGSETWPRVADASQCVTHAFYIDESATPMTIHLCPDACAAVEAAADATLELSIPCAILAE